MFPISTNNKGGYQSAEIDGMTLKESSQKNSQLARRPTDTSTYKSDKNHLSDIGGQARVRRLFKPTLKV